VLFVDILEVMFLLWMLVVHVLDIVVLKVMDL